ncbi:hypothetical protein ACIXSW_21375, partial [Bacteroides fragilis]
WIGVSDPDFTYGLNLQASYKNVDLALFFQGVHGGDVWDSWIEWQLLRVRFIRQNIIIISK